MREARIPSNIMVKVVDPNQESDLVEAVWGQYLKKNPEAVREDHLILMDTFGYVETPRGVFVLDSDGVGSNKPIGPDNKLEIACFVNKKGRFGLFPFVTMGTTSVDGMKVLGEVPLENFIRSFGNRLEGNYSIWLKALQEDKEMA